MGVKVKEVANLRFMILTRREGESVHDSDKFATEEYADIEELKEAVCHYIDVQYEDEETNGSENDDRNDDGDDLWPERRSDGES